MMHRLVPFQDDGLLTSWVLDPKPERLDAAIARIRENYASVIRDNTEELVRELFISLFHNLLRIGSTTIYNSPELTPEQRIQLYLKLLADTDNLINQWSDDILRTFFNGSSKTSEGKLLI